MKHHGIIIQGLYRPIPALLFGKAKAPWSNFPGLRVEHVRLVLGRQALEPRRMPKGQPDLLLRTAPKKTEISRVSGTPTALVQEHTVQRNRWQSRLVGFRVGVLQLWESRRRPFPQVLVTSTRVLALVLLLALVSSTSTSTGVSI